MSVYIYDNGEINFTEITSSLASNPSDSVIGWQIIIESLVWTKIVLSNQINSDIASTFVQIFP